MIELFNRLVRVGDSCDLSRVIAAGMPVFPFHVPFFMMLHRRHGDVIRPGDTSFANEFMSMTGHLGTHLDALGHFSRDGRVLDGRRVEEIQGVDGLKDLDAGDAPILWRRGILLDVPALLDRPGLDTGEGIDAEQLADAAHRQGTEIASGDVVLVRTGWGRNWHDAPLYNGERGGYPGVDPSGARWLVGREPFVVGADTHTFEVSPPQGDSVHGILIADAGIRIIENLDLEELAAKEIHEFLFVGLPLRIRGATGSPMRAIAMW